MRSQTNQSEDIPEGILDLADSTTVLNIERSAVDGGTGIDELPGHRIERLHAALRDRPADPRWSLPVRRMKSELDIAEDNRVKAGSINLSGENPLIPRHSSLDLVDEEYDPLDPPEHLLSYGLFTGGQALAGSA